MLTGNVKVAIGVVGLMLQIVWFIVFLENPLRLFLVDIITMISKGGL